MQEEIRTRTYEELLINRITKAFESMDNVNAEFFDEILDELEMLFKLKPDMYDQLMKWKKYHATIFQQNMELAKKKVSQLDDEIAQDITVKYYQTKIDWSYRKDMLETMINILNEYKMIPFTNPEYAEIESIETLPPETEPEIPEELPPEPPIQPSIPNPIQQHPQPIINSPTIRPTNIPSPPKTYSQPSPQDKAIMDEALRLEREETEIKRLSQRPPPPPPQKKGLGLFKKI